MQLLFIFSVIFMPLFTLGNYVLYEITAFNAQERAFLYSFHIKKPTVFFINGVSNEAAIPMDVLVTNDTAEMFEDTLNSHDIQYIYVSQIQSEQILRKKKFGSRRILNSFYDWESIVNWIHTHEKNNELFQKTDIAKTFEGRDIFLLQISKGKKRPIVFIVGGEDGMDWMSSALILNLFNELIDSTTGLNVLLNKFDFYLLPILNPDGFDYSQKEDRLWSKNRRIFYPQSKCPDGKLAVGVSIARNWFFQKNARMIDEDCNSINIGHRALSEEETQALSYVLNNLSLDMIAFINIKGFGQLITVPYGHTKEQTNNHDIIMEVLRSTCSKILDEYNTTYFLGTTSNYFYNFSGNMADWVKLKLNTPLVYTVYLEDESTVLPLSRHIQPLKKQLFTILNESLLITYDIYGPLFNSNVNQFLFYMKGYSFVYIYFFYDESFSF